MATRADVELARRSLRRLSRAADADLAGALAGVDVEDRAAARAALQDAVPPIVDAYGGAAAALGADVSEMWLGELGVHPVVAWAAPTVGQAAGSVRWAMLQPVWISAAKNILDVMVLGGYRSTVSGSAVASGVGWARVPSGTKTCAHCTMMASRDVVFRSEERANQKWHGACDCQIVMVNRNGDGFPEGYNPKEYFDRYAAGRASAEAKYGRPNTSQILSEMRGIFGIS